MPPKCAAHHGSSRGLKPPESAARDCLRELDWAHVAEEAAKTAVQNRGRKPPRAPTSCGRNLGKYASSAVATATARSPTTSSGHHEKKEEGKGAQLYPRRHTWAARQTEPCSTASPLTEYGPRVSARAISMSTIQVVRRRCSGGGRGHRRRANLKHLWGSGE